VRPLLPAMRRSNAACTDSNHGRETERRDLNGLEYGMRRFHRAMSLTLVVLASLILVIELCRAVGPYPGIVLLSFLTPFCLTIQRLATNRSHDISAPQLLR